MSLCPAGALPAAACDWEAISQQCTHVLSACHSFTVQVSKTAPTDMGEDENGRPIVLFGVWGISRKVVCVCVWVVCVCVWVGVGVGVWGGGARGISAQQIGCIAAATAAARAACSWPRRLCQGTTLQHALSLPSAFFSS